MPGSNPGGLGGPQGSVRSLNAGAYCTEGHQCKSGLCSKEKRCYDKLVCPKYTSWHAPTKKCLWPCGPNKERSNDGKCIYSTSLDDPCTGANAGKTRVNGVCV